jgi:hypothetical protein
MTKSTVRTTPPATLDSKDLKPTQSRQPSAVRVFAVLGAGLTVLSAYCFTRWVFSDDFQPVPTGPDQMATWRFVGLRAFEFSSLAIVIWLYWIAVFNPLRQRRPMGFDGKLVLGATLCYVIDPTASLFNAPFAFNAYALEMGSWANSLPFMESPGQQLQADGPLWSAAYYVYLGLGVPICGRWLLDRIDRWRPGLTNATRYTYIFVVVMVFDFILENAMVRAEVYSFSGVDSRFSIWAGSLYQFPLYECLFVAMLCTPIIYLREARDDRGRSLAERGVAQLAVPARVKEFISFLAIAGFACLAFLAYWLPIAWMSNYADSYPELPSYMRAAAYCGTPGSGRLCAGQLINPDRPATVMPYNREEQLEFVEGKRYAPFR